MSRTFSIFFALLVASFATTASAESQPLRTAKDYVWDLDAIYPTKEAWERERAAVEDGLTRISQLKLQPLRSAGDLARLLSAVSDARRRAGRMAKVGLLQRETDNRSEEARLREETGRAVERRVEQAVAFVEPLIRRLGRETLERWIRADGALAPHQRRIERTPYAPREGMEEIASSLGLVAVAASDIFNEVVSTALVWPESPAAAGGGRLDMAAYYRLKKSADTAVRNEATRRFLTHLDTYRQLFGVMLSRRIEGDLLVARQRNLDDPTDMLLVVNDGIEPQSYRAMFAASRSARQSVARAAAVLARLQKVEQLTYTDLFVPVHARQNDYRVGEALDLIVAATAPLGDDYQKLLRRRFGEKWMHLPPAPHKGATVGVFWQVGGGHPHAVMNYSGDYASARTLAGAALLMMGYASVPEDRAPDRREEDFPVFSNALWTLGPLMLDREVLNGALTAPERIAILSAQLTWLIQSYVRNSLIAELESTLAQEIAAGKVMSGADISRLYLELLHEYFGSSVVVGEHVSNEWMTHRTLFYGPHYASFAAATAVAVALDERIAAGDAKAIAAVRDGIGRSRTHLSGEVLRDAGIDLSDPKTHEAVARRIGMLTEELTRLLEGGRNSPVRMRADADSGTMQRLLSSGPCPDLTRQPRNRLMEALSPGRNNFFLSRGRIANGISRDDVLLEVHFARHVGDDAVTHQRFVHECAAVSRHC